MAELHLGLEIMSHRSRVAQEQEAVVVVVVWVKALALLSWDRDCLNSARPIPILFQHTTTSESITLKGRDNEDDDASLYSQSAQVVGLKKFTSAQPVIPVTQTPVIVGQ